MKSKMETPMRRIYFLELEELHKEKKIDDVNNWNVSFITQDWMSSSISKNRDILKIDVIVRWRNLKGGLRLEIIAK